MAASEGSNVAPARGGRAASARAVPVADRLRSHTRELHACAEAAGVVRAVMVGTVTRAAYLCYLRNLHAVYESLERELRVRRREPLWLTLAAPTIYRAEAIAADLAALGGPEWRAEWPLVAAAERYRERIRTAAAAGDARLAAHAYTRYLGDLSGGRIVARLVARALALGPEQLRTYRFEGVANLAQFKERYRRAFDGFGDAETELLDEARAAFELNIALAEDVAAAVP